MLGQYFASSDLSRIDGVLRGQARNGRFGIASALNVLFELGFRSCRYFAVANDFCKQEDFFVLTNVVGQWVPGDTGGFKFPVSILRRDFDGSDRHPMEVDHENIEGYPQVVEMYEKAGLNAYKNVLVPVFLDDKLIGKLCLSWEGSFSDLTEEDMHSLQLVSSLLSRYRRLSADYRVMSAVGSIGKLRSRHFDTFCMGKLIEIVRETMGASICALFKYNWLTNDLTKICEVTDGLVNIDQYSESYAAGRHLTGRTFDTLRRRNRDDHASCVVLDIDQVSKEQSIDIDPVYYESLKIALHAPLSAVYGRFDDGESEYIVRIINQSGGGMVPFDDYHVPIFDRILRRVGHFIRDNRGARISKLLSSLAAASIADSKSPIAIARHIQKDLEDSFSDHLVILSSEKGTDTPNFIFNPGQDNVQTDIYAADRTSSSVSMNAIVQSFRGLNYGIVTVDTISSNGVGLKFSDRYTHVLFWRFGSDDIEGMFLIPFRSSREVSSGIRNMTEESRERLGFWAAIMTSALIAADSTITMMTAKRFVGQIGHEIKGPVTTMHSFALTQFMTMEDAVRNVTSVDEAKRIVSSMTTYTIEELDKHLANVGNLMDVAEQMAQDVDSAIDVTFSPVQIAELLRTIARRVAQEIEEYQNPSLSCDFLFNDALDKLQPVVCDKFLVEKIFFNIFRNSLKYSIPPGGGLRLGLRL